MTHLIRLVGALGMLCVVGGGGVLAQPTADTYFHEAAQQYVDGNDAAAQRAVAEGLRTAPSDPRLVALRKKLQQDDRPEDRQNSNSSSSDRQSQQNSKQSSEQTEEGDDDSSRSKDQGQSQAGNRNSSNGASQSGSSQSGQQSGGEQGQQQSSGSPVQSTDALSSDDATPEREDGQGNGSPLDTLSREQAERLLQALEGKERQLLRELQTRSATKGSVEKDW